MTSALNNLKSKWEAASDPARQEFLKRIGHEVPKTVPKKKLVPMDAAPEPWPDPDASVVEVGRVEAPRFPNIPGRWHQWVLDAAEAKAAPPDFVLGALLSSAAALIGNSRTAAPWDGWREPAILWSMLVGDPSSGKSPAVDPVMEILRRIQQDAAVGHVDAVRQHDEAKQVARVKRDGWLQMVKEANNTDRAAPPMPPDAIEPQAPVRPRVVISDTTIERFIAIAAGNPRGLLLQRDEGAGWLANMERHGGSDRQFWIEAFGGRPFEQDRVKNPEPLIVKHLTASVLMATQPGPLKRLLLQTDDDGLGVRFMYFAPTRLPPFKVPTVIPDMGWAEAALRRLHGLALADGEPVPVSFNPAARAMMAEWAAQDSEATRAAKGRYASYRGKGRGMVARLALVLEYLFWCGEEDRPEPAAVSEGAVAAAIDIYDGYLLPSASGFLIEGSASQAEDDAAAVAHWLATNRPSQLRCRDEERKGGFPCRGDRLKAACRLLVEAGWIRERQGNEKRMGRPAVVFEVNPALPTLLDKAA